jgi:hypothetical protein
MISQTISHYKILEKLGEGEMSPARTTEANTISVRSGGQNHPRTFLVPLSGFRSQSGIPRSGTTGCDFQDPRLTLQIRKGGQVMFPRFLGQ